MLVINTVIFFKAGDAKTGRYFKKMQQVKTQKLDWKHLLLMEKKIRRRRHNRE